VKFPAAAAPGQEKMIEEELTELNSQQHALIYLPSFKNRPHALRIHSLPTPALVLFPPVQ
jgi:hypothetical protein